MRVLVVVGEAAGGIGQHVDDLVTRLRGEGQEVLVVTSAATASRYGWADARLLWPFRRGLAALRGPLDWHRVMRLASTSDVVHAHGHQAAVVAAAAVLRARPRPVLVVSLHNDLPPARPGRVRAALARLVRGVVSASLTRADLVTGASPDLVGLARSLGARRTEQVDVPSPRTRALLGAARPDAARRSELLRAAGVGDDVPVVLSVARVAPQKRLDVLLDAARASTCPAAWVVVGDGDPALRAALEARAAALPGPVRVHLLGARTDVAAWLAVADLLVLTSRWEARSLVVQEAMAAGVPPVVTRAGGLPDLVGDAGTVLPVGDAAALASAVDRLLGDPGARARLGAAARELAASWPTPAEEARRWVGRYADLTAR